MGSRLPRGRGITAPILGIDIGGTKILAVRARGAVVEDSQTTKTPQQGPAAVSARVRELVDRLDPDRHATLVGVGVPGVAIDGRVDIAPNLTGWDTPVDFGAMLSEALGRSVVVGNDVNFATLAEQRVGSRSDTDNLLGVFVGTGVGAGIILNGQLRVGPRGLAGELGHLTVDPQGPPCSCGGNGHIESYVGRACLEQRARSAHADGRSSSLVDQAGDRRITSTVWHAAQQIEDPLAVELLEDSAQALAHGLAAVAAIVDVSHVVIGGGFASRLGYSWRAAVEHHANALRFGPQPIEVYGTSLGDVAGALGAALHVEDEYSRNSR